MKIISSPHAEGKSGGGEFRSPQNISGALQQNNVAASS